MRLFITACTLILFGCNAHSQTIEASEQVAEELAQQEELLSHNLILKVDLTSKSKNVQGMLKDDFTLFHEKIVSFQLDEDTNIMVVEHLGILTKKEVMELLTMYWVDDNSIISYE